MAWFNSIEILSKIIPFAQILIVILTVFTIWATVHRGNLEKAEKAKLVQEIHLTKSVLSDLKKKSEPRKILQEQKIKLAQLLPPPAKFQIVAACRMMDNESRNFAEDLINVFREMKWNIGKTNETFLDDVQGDIVVAITDDTQRPIADLILKALNKVGLKASNEPIRPGAISGFLDKTIYLIVGARK
jgi:hypothetical protein